MSLLTKHIILLFPSQPEKNKLVNNLQPSLCLDGLRSRSESIMKADWKPRNYVKCPWLVGRKYLQIRNFHIYVEKSILCVFIQSIKISLERGRHGNFLRCHITCYKGERMYMFYVKKKKRRLRIYFYLQYQPPAKTFHLFITLTFSQKMIYWGLCFTSFYIKAKIKRHCCSLMASYTTQKHIFLHITLFTKALV